MEAPDLEKDAARDPTRLSLQAQERRLWASWKRDPSEDNLRPLLNSLEPVMRDSLRRAGAGRVDIPPAALEAEALRQTLLALNSYSPRHASKASVATHVHTRLQKLHTYVLSYQNVGRLSGNWGRFVGPYTRAKEQLTQQLGRPPSAAEIATKTQLPLGHIQKLEVGLRKALVEEGAPEAPQFEDLSLRERDIYNLIYPELSPEEQVVFEHTTGFAGRPVLPALEIARQLGVPNYKVSRIRNQIASRMRSYLHPKIGP